jgi:Domain of unknown function (DUF4158)
MNEVTILAPNEVVEQLEASERLPQDIDPDTLRKYFTLTRPDLEQVDQCRGATNKLGFAVQLCMLRWRGHFLRDTREIPEPVLEILSLQLGVLPIPIDDYPQNEKTRFDHLERICQHLKFSRCDESQREQLLQHLTGTAQALPRSTALRQAAHSWLQEQKLSDRADHFTGCDWDSTRDRPRKCLHSTVQPVDARPGRRNRGVAGSCDTARKG